MSESLSYGHTWIIFHCHHDGRNRVTNIGEGLHCVACIPHVTGFDKLQYPQTVTNYTNTSWKEGYASK